MAGVKTLCVAGFVLVVLLNTAMASPFDPYAPWTEEKEDTPGNCKSSSSCEYAVHGYSYRAINSKAIAQPSLKDLPCRQQQLP